MSLLSRALVAVFAVILCAWFGLAVIQARDTARATSLLAGSRSLTAEQRRETQSLLDTAGTLNPDQMIPILRGVREIDLHEPAAAEQTLLAVTRREPLNVDAWVQLAFAAAQNHDVQMVRIAGARATQLHPRIR